jgi:hypothetical protein
MRRSPFVRSAAVTILALTVAGCGTVRVNSYAERGFDLQRYQTFGWGPADQHSTGDPRLDNNRFFSERIQEQVERGLVRRGLSKAIANSPDLQLHYHATWHEEIDINAFDYGSGYTSGDDPPPFVYEAGALTIDVVDPTVGKVVWRGWAESNVSGVIDNQRWMEERIDQIVAKIMERFPRRP